MAKLISKVACIALLYCAQVAAQMGGGMGGGMAGGGGEGRGAPPVMPNIDRETLIMSMPDNWHSGQTGSDENKMDFYLFPEDQDHGEWTEMLRQEAYLTTAGMPSAARVHELRIAGDEKNCPNFSSETLAEEPENGYSTFVWKQSCQLSEDQEFASLHKAVLGNDRLYILSKIWKSDPSNRIWRRWENYFEDVYVCDPNRSEHRCRPLARDPGNATGGGGRSAL
jgi:hypothetical protein